MASEISFSAQLNYSKSGASLSSQCSTVATVAGVRYADVMQAITTAGVTVTFGTVGTVGVFMLQNIDPTNYVDVGFDGTTYPIRLAAVSGTQGGFIIAQNNGSTIYARSSVTGCNLLVRGVAP
jgi:hypothetical protein